MKIKIALGIVVILLQVSCNLKKKTIETDNSDISKIARGKRLFENRCADCHDLPNANDYSNKEWIPIMRNMQAEAELTDAEHDLIYLYLIRNK